MSGSLSWYVLPDFLVPDTVVHEKGVGPQLSLGAAAGSEILVTLGIAKVVEQESLTVTIHGSKDGKEWLPQPLAAFPQKFYVGVSSVLVNLAEHPEVRFIRAEWKVNRWGRGDKTPTFEFYLFAKLAIEAA